MADNPMTTIDADGNVWRLKLIGEDLHGHSIVVLIPHRPLEAQGEIPRWDYPSGDPA